MLADGGSRLRHLEALRGQPGLFGKVASVPTATRTLAALADDDAIGGTVAAVDVARAQVRERAWRSGALPALVAAAAAGEPTGPLAIDLDATLIEAHSGDKDGAAKTYKRSWGFHPQTAWLDRGDGTGEALAIELRHGNAGANTAADQITMVDRAIAQLPELPDELEVLIRADTAGAVHKLLAHIRGVARGQFSVGMPFQPAVRTAIHDLPFDDDRWTPAITQQGTLRKGAAVAEITDLVNLSAWPTGARLIVRREPLHPGAQQTFDDIDGHRFTAFLTDQPELDIAVLDARHRAHARVEDRIRCAKNTGLAAMPLDTFERNQLWCQLVLMAADLLSFTQKLACAAGTRSLNPKCCATSCCTSPDGSFAPAARGSCTSKPTGPTHPCCSPRSDDSDPCPPPRPDRPDPLFDTSSPNPTTSPTSRPDMPTDHTHRGYRRPNTPTLPIETPNPGRPPTPNG